MAVKGFSCNPNASITETHHLLFRQNLPVASRQLFPNPFFASYPILNSNHNKKKTPILRIRAAAAAEESNSTVNVSSTSDVKGSGTTARGRRLLKIREEKRKREFDRLHNYPSWAKVLEDACKDDEELRAVLGDSIGDPEQMRKRIEERVRKKGRDFNKKKTGSVLSFKVSFRDFNPLDSYIWFELYGSPSDREVNLIGSVIQSWYVMGRLGAFNSSNLQLATASMEYDPLYDADKGFNVMPSSFHDISDVEFQDNWGRVCYLGIQQIVFGGRRMGDWEEGMTNPDYGYKYFKI
ncbi:alpha-galactosidase-like [Hibiscus syriacus]|uniref:Alpha-galactosidase-like n=1 Tax=Hibiscus syriacus TaxID=106335 RepID=A0A6A2XS23_HIBSY|nr:alpha-galactosidase-like [Hibiscus syriacus]